jgi:outer membrane protein
MRSSFAAWRRKSRELLKSPPRECRNAPSDVFLSPRAEDEKGATRVLIHRSEVRARALSQPHHLCRGRTAAAIACLLPASLAVAGCASPLDEYSAEQVRREVVRAAQLRAAEEPGVAAREAVTEARDLDGSAPLIPEPSEPAKPSEDLDGKPGRSVYLSLDAVVREAVRENLDVRIARIAPRIRSEQALESLAAFDPGAFAEASARNVEQPLQTTSVGGIPTSATARVQDTRDASVGLTKRLKTGGEATLSTGVSRVDDASPNQTLVPDPGTTTNFAFELSHPLLAGAGRDVALAEVRIAENTQRREVLALRGRLLSVVAEVETSYWQLFFAWRRVAVRQRVLNLTLETQRELEARRGVDVSPLQLAQVASFVEERQSELIDAQRSLRDASDRLKRLLNSDLVPLAGEEVIEPADLPRREPLNITATEAIATGLDLRPEIQQAATEIASAAIRVDVADNQRLPRLNVRARVQVSGLEEEFGESYGEVGDGEFVDFLVGGRFEMPLGNRRAEAAYRRQRLSRQVQTLNLESISDDVVLSIKQAMRAARSAAKKIATTRKARIAAEENLRTLEEREKTGEGLTAEFLLDLKLSTQQRLADAELREVAAVVDYNVARTRFLAAIGTLLDERGVRVTLEDERPVPSAENAPKRDATMP